LQLAGMSAHQAPGRDKRGLAATTAAISSAKMVVKAAGACPQANPPNPDC